MSTLSRLTAVANAASSPARTATQNALSFALGVPLYTRFESSTPGRRRRSPVAGSSSPEVHPATVAVATIMIRIHGFFIRIVKSF
jgi:hypothetical protein